MSQGLGIGIDDWSQLAEHQSMPEIDTDRMGRYRRQRVRKQLKPAGVAMAVFVSPVSLRHAVGHRNYALFQSHNPSAYLFVPPA